MKRSFCRVKFLFSGLVCFFFCLSRGYNLNTILSLRVKIIYGYMAIFNKVFRIFELCERNTRK